MKVQVGPVALGFCRYEKCPYYTDYTHPKTGHACAFGQPSCRLGKLDLLLTTYVIGFSVNLTHKLKCFHCRLSGHAPYLIPTSHKNNSLKICRRCGKKL